MKSKVTQTRIKWKNFYSCLKEVYGPTISVHLCFWVQMKGHIWKEQDPGEVSWVFRLCTKQAIFYQWQGYWTTAASPSEQVTWCHSNPGESQIAVRQRSSIKQTGSDSIPAEIYKEPRSTLIGKLLILIQLIWVKKQLTLDFIDASIIHIYTRKVNRQACDNHCRILLSVLGKILDGVLQNRRINHVEHGLLLESQCGFHKERGTVDIVLAARELSGTENWSLLDLCWSDQGIRYGQERRLLENHGKIRLFQKIHHHC